MPVIAICASLCDMDTCADFAVWAEAREPWLKKFLTLKNGTPSSATFYRLFRELDPKQFETFFRRVVINMLSLDTTQPSFTKKKLSKRQKRKFANWDEGIMRSILGLQVI